MRFSTHKVHKPRLAGPRCQIYSDQETNRLGLSPELIKMFRTDLSLSVLQPRQPEENRRDYMKRVNEWKGAAAMHVWSAQLFLRCNEETLRRTGFYSLVF